MRELFFSTLGVWGNWRLWCTLLFLFDMGGGTWSRVHFDVGFCFLRQLSFDRRPLFPTLDTVFGIGHSVRHWVGGKLGGDGALFLGGLDIGQLSVCHTVFDFTLGGAHGVVVHFRVVDFVLTSGSFVPILGSFFSSTLHIR